MQTKNMEPFPDVTATSWNVNSCELSFQQLATALAQRAMKKSRKRCCNFLAARRFSGRIWYARGAKESQPGRPAPHSWPRTAEKRAKLYLAHCNPLCNTQFHTRCFPLPPTTQEVYERPIRPQRILRLDPSFGRRPRGSELSC